MANGERLQQIIFGHPEFGPKIVQLFPRFFEVSGRVNASLVSLIDRGYENIDPLQRTVLNLASYVGIAAIESVTLVGNGLGTGAMKILRGMLEGTINAEYLRINPVELANYIDWGWVEQHRHHEFMREFRPELYNQIPDEIREQTEREWNCMRNRFEYTDRTGRLRVRASWTTLSLADRASRTDLIEPYRHIFPLGSKLMHATVSGLAMHFVPDEDSHRLAAPPTIHNSGEALIGTHLCLIAVTRTLSQAVGIEPEHPSDELQKDFRYVWEERVSE